MSTQSHDHQISTTIETIPADFQHLKLPYVIIVMDGNMALTDGKSVESLQREQADSTHGEVPITTPILLSVIPKSANVLFQD